jgi:hypothetical protein
VTDKKCCVCGRLLPKDDGVIIVLTDEERSRVLNPQDEYTYCKPCWSILSDPISGPALMSGVAQHHLRHLGVSNVEELTARYRASLTARAKRRS